MVLGVKAKIGQKFVNKFFSVVFDPVKVDGIPLYLKFGQLASF